MAERISIVSTDADGNGSVFATTEDGDVYVLNGVAYSDTARDVLRHGSINPDLWTFHRAIYGSKAYQDRGEESRLVYAERYEGFGEGTDLAHVY